MAKYKIIWHYYDGEVEEDNNMDEYYGSEEEAEEAALYGLSCMREGGEILEMSNPGDYPFDPDTVDDTTYEIVEEV